GAVDPDDYRVTVNAHKGYNVYRTNGVNYILAHDGDTFEKISRDFRISARNLRKFNDVSKNAQPVANEVIYIGRKKKRWDGNVLLHTVREGETLWSLGQSYGIRTKSLARLNKLKEGDALTPGTTIKIR
ncbi:hemagglutinin, partial [human gut metagenome]